MMKTYIANWEVRGLPDKPILLAGDSIQLNDADAERLVMLGALMQSVDLPIDQTPDELDLDTATKAQIIAYAESRYGLALSHSRTRDELVLALLEAQEGVGE